MANTKISALTSGSPAQAGDLIPIARSGANFSLPVSSIYPTVPSGFFYPLPMGIRFVPGTTNYDISSLGANSVQGLMIRVLEQVTINTATIAAAGIAVQTLSAAGTASGGSTVYTGTFPATANALKGLTFTVAGFTNANNNGTFACTASTSTSLTLSNANGAAETHAATATDSGFNYYSGLLDVTGNVLWQARFPGVTSSAAITNIDGVLSSAGYVLVPGDYFYVWGCDTGTSIAGGTLVITGTNFVAAHNTLYNQHAKSIWFSTAAISGGAIQNVNIASVSSNTGLTTAPITVLYP